MGVAAPQNRQVYTGVSWWDVFGSKRTARNGDLEDTRPPFGGCSTQKSAGRTARRSAQWNGMAKVE